jgi:hypothetical protein
MAATQAIRRNILNCGEVITRTNVSKEPAIYVHSLYPPYYPALLELRNLTSEKQVKVDTKGVS